MRWDIEFYDYWQLLRQCDGKHDQNVIPIHIEFTKIYKNYI